MLDVDNTALHVLRSILTTDTRIITNYIEGIICRTVTRSSITKIPTFRPCSSGMKIIEHVTSIGVILTTNTSTVAASYIEGVIWRAVTLSSVNKKTLCACSRIRKYLWYVTSNGRLRRILPHFVSIEKKFFWNRRYTYTSREHYNTSLHARIVLY